MPPRRRQTAKPQIIERSVHFYRVDCGDEGGKPVPFDAASALGLVGGRPFLPSADGGRYVTSTDGEDLCAWVDGEDDEPIGSFTPLRFRFARLRRNAIPQSELAGALTPVQLKPGSSLCETAHLLVLPNNLIGVELNFYAPRASRFPFYLQQLTSETSAPFAMEQLLRHDVLELLEEQQGIRVFELAIRPSYADTISQVSDSLGASLAAAAQVGDAQTVGVYLKADPYKRSDTLGSQMLRQVRRIAQLPGLRENARTARVRSIGPDGLMQNLDILQDQLVVSKRMASINPHSRAVDSESAYGAIREAYVELNAAGQLDDAPALASSS